MTLHQPMFYGYIIINTQGAVGSAGLACISFQWPCNSGIKKFFFSINKGWTVFHNIGFVNKRWLKKYNTYNKSCLKLE